MTYTAKKINTNNNYVSVNIYKALIFVNTDHGNCLESACDKAAIRNKKDKYSNYYIERLSEMLDDAFEKLGKGVYGVTDTCLYGDFSFWVEATSLELLQKMISVANKVIKKWINRYKVNGF